MADTRRLVFTCDARALIEQMKDVASAPKVMAPYVFAGARLRSLILKRNPLWQLTFHRSEISRQGHPWVLVSTVHRV